MRAISGIAALCIFSAVPAGAATTDCLDRSYDSADQAILTSHAPDFDLEKWLGSTASPELVAVLTRRVAQCADAEGWPRDAGALAIQYLISKLMVSRMVDTAPLSKPQTTRLLAGVDGADHDRLLALFRPELDGVPRDKRPAPNQADIDYFGKIIVDSGIPISPDNAFFIRTLVKVEVIRIQAANRLAELEKRNP